MQTSSPCLSNTSCPPAGLKQIKWESQRDYWIQDRDVKTLRRKKTMFNKKKMLGRARTGSKMFGNKKKKKKKKKKK